MTIKVKFVCDGCDAETEATKSPQRHFESVSGRSYGFGSWRYDSVADVAPPGWVAFDPYTGCCYCKDCWASIENGDAA